MMIHVTQNSKPGEPIGVTVKVFGAHREQFGRDPQRIELASRSTLRDLLAKLDGLMPPLASKLRQGLDAGYLQVLINGRNAEFLGRFEAPLEEGDIVAFLPPIGGG